MKSLCLENKFSLLQRLLHKDVAAKQGNNVNMSSYADAGICFLSKTPAACPQAGRKPVGPLGEHATQKGPEPKRKLNQFGFFRFWKPFRLHCFTSLTKQRSPEGRCQRTGSRPRFVFGKPPSGQKAKWIWAHLLFLRLSVGAGAGPGPRS